MKAQRGVQLQLYPFFLTSGLDGVDGQRHASASLLLGRLFIHCTGCWVAPGPAWTGAENLAPHGIRYPDRFDHPNNIWWVQIFIRHTNCDLRVHSERSLWVEYSLTFEYSLFSEYSVYLQTYRAYNIHIHKSAASIKYKLTSSRSNCPRAEIIAPEKFFTDIVISWHLKLQKSFTHSNI